MPCFLFFVAVVVVFPKLHSCQLLLVNLFLFLTKNTLIHGHRALAIITAVLAAAAAAVVVFFLLLLLLLLLLSTTELLQ